MPYSITRKHEFCYGHRVWLHEGKCANLHGHAGVVEFTVEPNRSLTGFGSLDNVGRVVDFSVVRERLCDWIETNWDHAMLIWDRDPALGALQDIDPKVLACSFNPTAENMARHLVMTVGPERLAGTGTTLVRVRMHETGKCSATYRIER